MNQELIQQYIVLYRDAYDVQFKETEGRRDQIRALVSSQMKNLIPESLTQNFSLEEQRLIRTYSLSPALLSEPEQKIAKRVEDKLRYWRTGGCYNLSPEQSQMFGLWIYRLSDRAELGRGVTLCTDLVDAQQEPMVNSQIGLVDVKIRLGPANVYRYPLTTSDSLDYLKRLESIGIDPNSLPQVSFPQLEQILTKIRNLSLSIEPKWGI